MSRSDSPDRSPSEEPPWAATAKASRSREPPARRSPPGSITPTAAPPRAFALFAHCFTCSKESRAATFIGEALADAGVATLRFDFTGLGDSEGEFANTNFSSNVADLVAAADWLRRTHRAPALLVGHSLGGAAVLAAAARIPEVAAVATINAPADPAHVARLFRAAPRRDRGGRRGRSRSRGPHVPHSPRIPGRHRRRRSSPRRSPKLRRALLVFHAPRDTTVGIDNAAAIFGAAKHPKSFVSLDDADHLLTRRDDAAYVGTVLAAWASRSLPPALEKMPDGPREIVSVRETRVGKFQQAIAIGPHRLVADEPVAAGGLDSGPSPYDLLLAGLGACTAMTVRMYADQKQLPLERVGVRLVHDKIHADDCADCETKEGKIDRIERVVTLEGDLDDAARAKLLEIASKCPVHRTLHGEVTVPTRAG